MAEHTARTSAEETIERFDTPAAAAKYAKSLGATATHRREIRCIHKALRDVRAGAAVLDLPCGTGRLLPNLLERGFRVTEADSSPHMVAQAKLHAQRQGLRLPDASFVVASVFETGFGDSSFDATVCNRLFHHFRESQVRQRALRELARITRGPIVISFFCNSSFDAGVFHIKNAFARAKAVDRIPISRGVLAQDIRAAGLTARRWLPTRPGISKQWYVVVERA